MALLRTLISPRGIIAYSITAAVLASAGYVACAKLDARLARLPGPVSSQSSAASVPGIQGYVRLLSSWAVESVPTGFSKSRTVMEVANHAGHRVTADSRGVEMLVWGGVLGTGGHGADSGEVGGVGDEEILATFTESFFGGVVLAPERALLRSLGFQFVRFSRVQALPDAQEIWTKADLSTTKLPPASSVIFGTFQVLLKRIAGEDNSSTGSKNAGDSDTDESFASYVDLGFGSDESWFAGVHRFSVSRVLAADHVDSNAGSTRAPYTHIDDPASKSAVFLDGNPAPSSVGSAGEVCSTGNNCRKNEDYETLILSYHGTTCNPRTDRPQNIFERLLFRFHLLYADLLFRESVAAVVSRLEERGSRT